jgi:hypothetical protein
MVFAPITYVACGGNQSCAEKNKRKIPNTWNLFTTNTWETVPIFWTFDCSFPNQYREHVRKGFKYWDDLTYIDLFIEVRNCIEPDGFKKDDVSDLEIVIITWQSGNCPWQGSCGKTIATAHRNTCGDTYYCTSYITFWRPWFHRLDGAKTSVVMHELGHILGMRHVPERRCLMYPFMHEINDANKKACKREIVEFRRRYERIY